jgi:hypothetical protein
MLGEPIPGVTNQSNANELVDDESFRPTHPQDATGFSAFMNEISDLLGEFGMQMVHGREESRAGKWFWALARTAFIIKAER